MYRSYDYSICHSSDRKHCRAGGRVQYGSSVIDTGGLTEGDCTSLEAHNLASDGEVVGF